MMAAGPESTQSSQSKIAALLGDVDAPGSFSSRRTASPDDLWLEVRGVGQLHVPIPTGQARELRRIARPARYGLGEQTLIDPTVRDTWQIPRSRVKIDKRRWNRTLLPILDELAAGLGMPAGSRLIAELHSMLVYTRGQFFRPHQDSEKDDRMVASLVITLPGTFSGGSLVVEHGGERTVYRSSKDKLSFVAFYADCRHEVRPVRSGHRVVLTYNLMLAEDDAGPARPVPGVDAALAVLLGNHFQTPIRSRWRDAEGSAPNRLVYLLDHQYTERGLSWTRLKGGDAVRAAALRGAADRADCDVAVGLADVHETWSCTDEEWDGWHDRRGWTDLDDADEDDADEWADSPPDSDAYELGELLDSGITVDSCIDPSGAAAEPLVARIDDTEVCATTPSVQLEPYESEYEGYMGNYGNTMDRWYRRAAVLIWPRVRAFEVHAEASPGWALSRLADHIRAGDVATARTLAATLEPFWDATARGTREPDVVASALRVAADLDRADVAAMLLRPLRLESLTCRHVPDLVAVAARYGDGWSGALLAGWFTAPSPFDHTGQLDRRSWVASLAPLCDALRTADRAPGARIALLLLHDTWAWLDAEITRSREIRRPSDRDQALAELAAPIAGFLAGVAVGAADDLRDAAIATLCADDAPLSCLVQVLRHVAQQRPADARVAAGVDAVRRHCARRLAARLARAVRADDDWSIADPGGCGCGLCATLGDFLADPARRRFEWPIKQESRRHVHSRIDRDELPVDHRTIRKGRPYTLVLAKTRALFEREAQARRRDEADLAWLDDRVGAGR
ncbi:2OG-Fe(II) oxygenase [Rhodococcus sp. WS4]|nr:2OG-Fe(II) oxygenase [Rhodococcus sp. WS4]